MLSHWWCDDAGYGESTNIPGLKQFLIALQFSLLKLPYFLAIWTAAAFCAPALGPVLSGFAVMAKNWHWSLWIVLWMSGPVLLIW